MHNAQTKKSYKDIPQNVFCYFIKQICLKRVQCQFAGCLVGDVRPWSHFEAPWSSCPWGLGRCSSQDGCSQTWSCARTSTLRGSPQSSCRSVRDKQSSSFVRSHQENPEATWWACSLCTGCGQACPLIMLGSPFQDKRDWGWCSCSLWTRDPRSCWSPSSRAARFPPNPPSSAWRVVCASCLGDLCRSPVGRL